LNKDKRINDSNHKLWQTTSEPLTNASKLLSLSFSSEEKLLEEFSLSEEDSCLHQ
jgi:hypothetical protein